MKKTTTIILCSFLLCFALASNINDRFNQKVVMNQDSLMKCAPDCIQMQYYIQAYADTFDIPERYAFGIAYLETRYSGPTHLSYSSKQKSHCGALGPMQIMPATARQIEGKTISKKRLMNDIEYNVRISLKLLRTLHDKYNKWDVVFGVYNTGKPIVNSYAKKVCNYEPRWSVKNQNNLSDCEFSSLSIGN